MNVKPDLFINGIGSTNIVASILVAAITICCGYLWFREKPAHSPIPTPPRRTPLTYRVRGVPLDWEVSQLQSFLATLAHSPDPGPTIGSLATEIHGRSRTATVAFQPEGSREVPFADLGWSKRQIALDHDFLGITTLYTPSEDHHKVEYVARPSLWDRVNCTINSIIAIPGLGGHAFGSFKQRDGDYMWLRDALPHHITGEDGKAPCARVMVYGYDSRLPASHNTQNMEDLALSLIGSLLRLAMVSTTPKPIIFIAHDLGGLVIKQALIYLSKSTDDHSNRLLEAVYGLIFFGVPHDGMNINSFIPMVEDGPNRFLLESIGNESSQVLSHQQLEFPKAVGRGHNLEIVCFFETRKSPTFIEIDGEWKRQGPTELSVNKASATHCPPWECGTDHISPIDRNHSNMVKFGRHDHEYDHKVLPRIQAVVQRACVIRHPTLPAVAQRCLQSLDKIDLRFQHTEPSTERTSKRLLLSHKPCKTWASFPRGLLWTRGKPGSGKSTLLKHVLADITGTKTARTWNWGLALSFFYGRGAELQWTPCGLYQSPRYPILQQASGALRDITDTFNRRLREKGEQGEKWEWHPNQLWDSLKFLVLLNLQIRRIWFFIDPLDKAARVANAKHPLNKTKLLFEWPGIVEGPLSYPDYFTCVSLAVSIYPVLKQDFGDGFINTAHEVQGDISTYNGFSVVFRFL